MTNFILYVVTQFVFGFILQSMGCILTLYIVHSCKIKYKEYFIYSALLTLVSFVARELPISFGVHTLITTIGIVLIGWRMFGGITFKTVVSAVLATVLIVVSEVIVTILFVIFEGYDSFMLLMESEGYQKYIPGNMATVIFMLLEITLYLIMLSKTRKRMIQHGETV